MLKAIPLVLAVILAAAFVVCGGDSTASTAAPSSAATAVATVTKPTEAPKPVTSGQLTSSYDLCATYFNTFWSNWRTKVAVPLAAGRPDYASADVYGSAYQKYAADCAKKWDGFVSSPATEAALAQGRKSYHELADGAAAAAKAGQVSDKAALEAAATLVSTGANDLNALVALIDALPK